MPYRSPDPDLDIPKTDILSYLFPTDAALSDQQIWIDAADPSKCLTPRQLLGEVKRLGAGLQNLGIQPGRDVCLIFTPNHIFVPVAYLGIVGYGALFSGVNPAYTIPEIAHQIRNTKAKLVLVHPSLAERLLPAAAEAGLPKDRIFLLSDRQKEEAIHGIGYWRTMSSPSEGNRWRWTRLGPQAASSRIATINYSSGTTGLPKGVCVSHSNLIANVEQTIFSRSYNFPKPPPQERWVGFLPLYHAYGQLYTILMATKLQVPIYIMETFQYRDFLKVIERYKITTLQTAPPVLVMLSKRPETAEYDLSSVKDILCGAAPLSQHLQNDVATRFNALIHQGWGMTEVTCGAIMVPGGVRDETGSVGTLLPNVECKLLDDDENEVENRGELYVRGPNICLGYWDNEEATKESFKDGWLKTGDVAFRDEKGYFWIVDRKKASHAKRTESPICCPLLTSCQELIKVNAFQVAPAELEAVLLEHEDIADAAVVGITLNHNELPRAYVVLKEGTQGKVSEKGIQDWIKKRVAKHKWLTGGVSFVDEVPKLASGKIKRKEMREWAKRDQAMLEAGQQKIMARL